MSLVCFGTYWLSNHFGQQDISFFLIGESLTRFVELTALGVFMYALILKYEHQDVTNMLRIQP